MIVATLDLSRIESGRMTLDLADVALADFLGEIEAETRVSWSNPAVTLSWSVPPSLATLRTDALKLKVIVRNLVGNALKFTEKGFVRVSAAATRAGIEISVADSGIGIEPAARDYIFEAFRQGDSSATRRHGGAGLGLYTVRRLLDLLGGEIDVDSTAGVGSTFRLRLPLVADTRSLAA